MLIDLHFHILPGIDDGPSAMDDALLLARAAEEAGTGTVIATPHVSWRWPDNDALSIAHAVLLLKRELQAAGIDLDVRRGAEVALTRAADLEPEALRRLGLAGGPWLLLECPSSGGGAGLETALRSLLADGHQLLLAHPERIPAFRDDPELVRTLSALGLRSQVTAGALTGRFGRDVKRFALWMIEQGLVDVVASDAHSLTNRPPTMAPELHKAGIRDALVTWLTQEAPAALLAGEEIPPAPVGLPRVGRLRRVAAG